MPLWIAWQKRELALYRQDSAEAPIKDSRLSRLELDFDLTPLGLFSDRDRLRLCAALIQLQQEAEANESQVNLLIPPRWGIAQGLPQSLLHGAGESEHLQWELSKLTLDPIDQYRYNFAGNADQIFLVAVRTALYEQIRYLLREVGLELKDLRFDTEPWNSISLTEVPTPAWRGADSDVEAPVKKKKERPPKEPTVRKPRGEGFLISHNPRFFTALLIVCVLVIAAFVWWKLTTRKPISSLPEPRLTAEQTTATPETQPGVSDSVKTPDLEAAKTAPETAQSIPSARLPQATPTQVETTAPPAAGRSTPLTQRLLELVALTESFDLISLTQDRFVLQVTSAPSDLASRVQAISGILDVKASRTTKPGGKTQVILRGALSVVASAEAASFTSESALIALAKQHGLQTQGLVFTGNRQAMTSFLTELKEKPSALDRLNLVPWEGDQLRLSVSL